MQGLLRTARTTPVEPKSGELLKVKGRYREIERGRERGSLIEMIPTGRGGSCVEVNQPHGWEEKQLMTFFVFKPEVKARSKVSALSELIYFVDGEPLCFFLFQPSGLISQRMHSGHTERF